MRNVPKSALAAGSRDPDVVHSRLESLSKCQSARDVEIGDWLLIAEEIDLYEFCGYASTFEYCDRVFGWNGRTTFDRLRVAKKLLTLHATRQALLDGEITWSIAREISRASMTPDVEAEWLKEAKGKTVREIEEKVAGRGPNEPPSAPRRKEHAMHTVVLKLTAVQYAQYLEGVAEEREATGDPSMSEEAAVAARMKRKGEAENGTSAFQLAFVQKVGTDEVFVQSPRGPLAVSATAAELVSCDANVVPAMVDGAIVEKASQTIPPAVRRQTLAEAGGMCEGPGCRNCGEHVHHNKFRSDGGDHDPRFLASVCEFHHNRLHDGFILLEGDRVSGWIWKHADGTPYGRRITPKLQGEIGDAYQGLRRLGYKDPDARRASMDAAAALQREGVAATGAAIVTRALRDAGKAQARTYAMKPSAHVGTSASTAQVGTTAGTAATGRAAPAVGTADVDDDAAMIADVGSGLASLGFKDGVARAKAVCEALRATGAPVTVEKALTEALRTRGAALLTYEGTGGGESMTGEAAVEYGSTPTAHVGSDDLATLLPLFEAGKLDDIAALEKAWYREIQRELALAGL